MPIWSLTKERVEKLLSQIGASEIEIDTLIKLSREDLWSKDLDDFINEWRTQLQEENNQRKKMASLGRRASSKLNIDAKVPGRKRKAQGGDDDSDFGTKAVARKPAVVKRAQPKSGLLSELSPLAKPVVKAKPATSPKAKTLGAKAASGMLEDTKPPKRAGDALTSLESAPASDVTIAPIFQKAKTATISKRTAPAKKVKSEDEDDQEADQEIIRPAVSRKPRQAAKKVPTYNLDDSDSNGDDMLLDVGKMVKGIDNGSSDQATTTRPLFSTSMSRPGSSAGLPKKSSSLARHTMDVDGDDTDYSKLAPPPAAKRGVSITARKMVISDDEIDDDDDDFMHVGRKSPPPKATGTSKAPKAAAPKPAAKAKGPATAAAKRATKETTSQPAKKMPLSPAAKAYAAKRARNKPIMLDEETDDEANEGEDEEEDEVEKVANAILDEGNDGGDDDDEEEEVVARRPARRAAAVKAVETVKKVWGDESEEEEEEEDDGDEDGDEDSAMFDDDGESE